ncbi:hypothetical protein P8452_38511 [Trifolium repens]|nr:hypothetical protein P8452_38511 [Trifolium repens]
MPWTLPMAFVDDVAAGHRHHHDATSCQSRKTKASRIKIVDRSSKSGTFLYSQFSIDFFLLLLSNKWLLGSILSLKNKYILKNKIENNHLYLIAVFKRISFLSFANVGMFNYKRRKARGT